MLWWLNKTTEPQLENVLCMLEIHLHCFIVIIHPHTSSCSIISTVQWSYFSEEWHQYVYQVVKMKCGILESSRGASDIFDTILSITVLVQSKHEPIHWSIWLSQHYSFEKCLNKNKKSGLILSNEINFTRTTPKGSHYYYIHYMTKNAKWYYDSCHQLSWTSCKFQLYDDHHGKHLTRKSATDIFKHTKYKKRPEYS